MSTEARDVRWHVPFGPIILQSTLSKQTWEILLVRATQLREGTHPNKDINTKTNDYRKKLAGCLSEEYSYAGAFNKNEMNIVEEELTWLASIYTDCAKKAGKIKSEGVRKPKELIMQKPVWVNFMKSGEWNPSHNHTGKLSCVTYLQVPPEIEDENTKGEHTKESNTPSAGRIEWQFGNVGMPYATGGFIKTPKVRDVFFFPAALSHQVYPFQSDAERISVSVNFADRLDAERDLSGSGER
tara:strand:- start:111 stop:833 length:723 start_codon:yes stop_codon:yes gene_type:complete